MKSAKTVRLGDVCEFRRGLTYSKADEAEYTANAVLRSNNIDLGSNTLNLSELRYLKDGFNIPPEKRVVKDSILICMANGSKEHLGKVAFIDRNCSYAFGGFMGLLVPQKINSRYLFHCLCAPQFRWWIISLTDGTNINNLKFSNLAEFSLPLPPLSEQKAIAARLDAALARATRLAEHFTTIAKNAELSFKASLKEEFAGRTGGTGETSGTGGSSDSRSSSTSRNPSDPSKPWPLVRLGDVCEVVLGGTPSTQNADYWGGGIPWLTPGEMRAIQGRYVEHTERTLTEAGLEAGSRLFPARSVVLSTRAPIGYVFINTVPMATNQGCKTLVPSTALLPEYLYYNLLGRTAELNALGTGTTFKELATGTLKNITLPLPPLTVQRAIVSRLDAARARSEGIAEQARRGAAATENLKKALLKEAFE